MQFRGLRSASRIGEETKVRRMSETPITTAFRKPIPPKFGGYGFLKKCLFYSVFWRSLKKIGGEIFTPPNLGGMGSQGTSRRSIKIHLQFVLQYTTFLYCSAFGTPELWGKGKEFCMFFAYFRISRVFVRRE